MLAREGVGVGRRGLKIKVENLTVERNEWFGFWFEYLWKVTKKQQQQQKSFMVIGLGFVYVFNLKNTTFVLLCNNNK